MSTSDYKDNNTNKLRVITYCYCFTLSGLEHSHGGCRNEGSCRQAFAWLRALVTPCELCNCWLEGAFRAGGCRECGLDVGSRAKGLGGLHGELRG